MRFAVLLAVLLVGGCSFSLQNELPQNTVWRLAVPPHQPVDASPFAVHLVIVKPHLPTSLRTERLVLEQVLSQVDVLAGHQWEAALPDLLQDYWLEYFQATGRYAAVSPSSSTAIPAIQLTSYLWHFDTRSNLQTGDLEVRLKLHAYLTSGRNVPINIVFDEVLPLRSEMIAQRGKVAAVVDAHNRLLAQVSNRIHQALVAHLSD
jgi:ABC-type uncharacterized transport system auxiliary subunit